LRRAREPRELDARRRAARRGAGRLPRARMGEPRRARGAARAQRRPHGPRLRRRRPAILRRRGLAPRRDRVPRRAPPVTRAVATSTFTPRRGSFESTAMRTVLLRQGPCASPPFLSWPRSSPERAGAPTTPRHRLLLRRAT